MPAYRKKFANGEADFYHLKCSATSHLSDGYQNIVQRSQYIAVAHIENDRYFVEYVYPIQYIVIQRREEISIEMYRIDTSANDPGELYWCVHLAPSIPLPKALEITSSVGDHMYGISISELFVQAQTQTDISG